MVDTEESRFHLKELILLRTYGGAVGSSGTPWGAMSHDEATVPQWGIRGHTGVETRLPRTIAVISIPP